MIFLKKILVTTDLSPFSLAAMEYATSFGMLYTSKLYLLHVLEGKEGHHAKDDERRAAGSEADSSQDERSRRPGRTPSRSCGKGSPAEEIKRFAQEEGIDLIVMATHGRTGLRHMVMGSVAETSGPALQCPRADSEAPSLPRESCSRTRTLKRISTCGKPPGMSPMQQHSRTYDRPETPAPTSSMAEEKKTILLYSPDLNFCFSLSMLFQDRYNVITTTNPGMLDKFVADYSANLVLVDAVPSEKLIERLDSLEDLEPKTPHDPALCVQRQGCRTGQGDSAARRCRVLQAIRDRPVSRQIEELPRRRLS